MSKLYYHLLIQVKNLTHNLNIHHNKGKNNHYYLKISQSIIFTKYLIVLTLIDIAKHTRNCYTSKLVLIRY